MKKIALYVRVSTEEAASQPEGSLKSQEQRLRDYVAKRNEHESWGDIKAVFVERGKSAKDMSRPELQKLLSGIGNQLFDLVMVTEISRLSRSTKDFCNMLDLFKAHDCKILSLREQFDTTSAAGEMMMHMLMNLPSLNASKQQSESPQTLKPELSVDFTMGELPLLAISFMSLKVENWLFKRRKHPLSGNVLKRFYPKAPFQPL